MDIESKLNSLRLEVAEAINILAMCGDKTPVNQLGEKLCKALSESASPVPAMPMHAFSLSDEDIEKAMHGKDLPMDYDELKQYAREIERAIMVKAMPIPKQETRGQNRYGLDMSYMVGKLNILIRDIDSYKSDEAARTLLRLAKVADESVFKESEFSMPAQAAAIPELQKELDRLKHGIAAIVKTVKPLSNFDEYQVLAMSPHQLINHVNDLLSASPKPE